MTGKEFYQLTPELRKVELDQLKVEDRFAPPEGLASELHVTYRYSRALDTLLLDYFKSQLEEELEDFEDNDWLGTKLYEKRDGFLESILTDLKSAGKSFTARATRSPRNLYELGGAFKLAFSNNATRTISTRLGLFWEDIACLSPLTANPEKDFLIKLNGIDAILYSMENETITYAQIKSQRNTLTGSQAPRSNAELSMHDNNLFVACFDTAASWTFGDQGIPRIVGADFWNLIRFNYEEIIDILTFITKKIDDSFDDLIK